MRGSKLAEKLTELGVPWNRTTVAKFETGHRHSLTIQELLALAVALRVPLIWLLADPTAGEIVPIAKGLEVDPWAALSWMAGKSDTTGDWHYSHAPLAALYQVVEIVAGFRRQRSERVLTAAFLEDPGHDDQALDQRERLRLTALQDPLRYLLDQGYQLPVLPGDVLDRAAELGVELPGREG